MRIQGEQGGGEFGEHGQQAASQEDAAVVSCIGCWLVAVMEVVREGQFMSTEEATRGAGPSAAGFCPFGNPHRSVVDAE